MSQDRPGPEPVDDFVAVALAMLKLPAAAEYLPGIRANWETITRMGLLVLEAPLDDREEPAPVYRP